MNSGNINRSIFCSLILILFASATHAQLTNWSHRQVISITEQEGVDKYDYPVLLKINTKALVDSGQLQSSGADLRFAEDCAGNGLFSYWIEAHMNTDSTLIWVNIDTFPANSTKDLLMFYGNPTASAVSNRDSTFTDKQIISTDQTISDTAWNYDLVEIQSGATVSFSATHIGSLKIIAPKIIIDGTLDGNGAGYAGGVGGDGQGRGEGVRPISPVEVVEVMATKEEMVAMQVIITTWKVRLMEIITR